VTSFNSKEKQPDIQRYDALCEKFGEIAEVVCENQKATKLLFPHLQAFANTHDMSLPRKVHNLQTKTPQTSNSINDSLNQPIRSPIPVNRKG